VHDWLVHVAMAVITGTIRSASSLKRAVAAAASEC